MPLSLYDVSIPLYLRALANLSAILDRAVAFAEEKGIPHSDLLEARLYEDMAPLTRQIQFASDTARFTAKRVGQIDVAPIADDESSFDELKARIAATIAVLERAPASCMDGREEALVELQTPEGAFPFSGRDYVLVFAVPNFFFHVTTAYDILRHKGVPIGKLDYLGQP